MPDLGIDVLLKGSNMLRLLQGVGVAVQISLAFDCDQYAVGHRGRFSDDRKN